MWRCAPSPVEALRLCSQFILHFTVPFDDVMREGVLGRKCGGAFRLERLIDSNPNSQNTSAWRMRSRRSLKSLGEIRLFFPSTQQSDLVLLFQYRRNLLVH